MDRDWSRLGAKLAQARKQMGLRQPELGEQIGVGRATIQKIEAGTPFKNITPAIRDYAEFVGWTYDSVPRVLAGGEPEAGPPVGAPSQQTADQDLPPALALELHTGQTLDSTVVHLGPEDSDARIIVVLKGEANMTEEQLEEAWRRWRKSRRHLQGVTSEAEPTPDPS